MRCFDKWIPRATGALLIVLFLAANLFPGFWTWPFNNVAYLGRWGGSVLLVALLAVLAVTTSFRSRLLSLNPSVPVQGGILLIVLFAFIALTLNASVYVPDLEGDGGIDHDYESWRWSDVLIRRVAPALGLKEYPAALVTWHLMGAIYIIGAALFVAALRRDFWSRFWGLLLCAVVPPVLNFTGHFDSYAITFTCLSAFLAVMYLAALRPSLPRLMSAAALLYVSYRAHPYSVVALVYPICWAGITFIRGRGRRWVITLIPAAVVLAGLILPPLIYPERHVFGWGRWLITVARKDGLPTALIHNFYLHLSYLFPFLFALAALLPSRPWDRNRGASAAAAAFLGSVSILLLIAVVGIFSPPLTLGTRDFICMAGNFGGLFFVPMLILLIAFLREWMYCFVLFSMFLTFPALIVQRGPESIERLRAALADDRGTWLMRVSPYLDAGGRIFSSLAARDRPELPRLGCEILEQGGRDDGFYRRFAPINLWQAVLFRYRMGERAPGRENLHALLRRWPRTGSFFLRKGAQTFAGGNPTEEVVADAKRIAASLLKETGETIYEDLLLRLEFPPPRSPRPFTFAEISAAVAMLYCFDSPSAPREEENVQAWGWRVLTEKGMADLIVDAGNGQ